MISTKRKLAQIRNFTKYRLKGLSASLSSFSSYSGNGLTEEERYRLNEAKKIIDSILYGPLWDMNTKEIGLTPKKKKRDDNRTD